MSKKLKIKPWTVADYRRHQRLIQAAPDLLAACKALASELESMVDWSETDNPIVDGASRCIDSARAAIAKAEGGAP